MSRKVFVVRAECVGIASFPDESSAFENVHRQSYVSIIQCDAYAKYSVCIQVSGHTSSSQHQLNG